MRVCYSQSEQIRTNDLVVHPNIFFSFRMEASDVQLLIRCNSQIPSDLFLNINHLVFD